MPTRISPERDAAQRVLYEAGWMDKAIGAAFGVHAQTIYHWRTKNGLPVIANRIDHEVALKLYEAGATDGKMARELGFTRFGVQGWRRRQGLPPNGQQVPAVGPERRRVVRKLLRQGASGAQIREATGVSEQTICAIRARLSGPGLRKTGISNKCVRAWALADKTLEPRIMAAIGKDLPRDVRHDAFSALYTDILDGRVDRQFIEEVAPSYRSRAFDMCGSKFGARSMEEEIGEDWLLGDTIADDDALAAMEEAAELAFDSPYDD